MTALPTRTRARSLRKATSIDRPFPAVLFGLVLLATVSRGAIQMAVGQSIAYVVQTGAVALFLVVIAARSRSRPTRWAGPAFFLVAVFIVGALVSVVASLWVNDIEFGIVLAAVMSFLAVILAVGVARDFRWSRMERAGHAVVIVVWIQIAVAVAQQVFLDRTFPGNARTGELVRPAALTGSYLHYPIELALLAFLLIGMFVARRRWLHLVTGMVGLAAVILSQSRSGMVLVLVGLAVGTLFLSGIGARLRIVGGGVFAVVGLLLLFPSNNFVARFLSIGVVEGSINEVRVGIWDNVLDIWARSPLIIGTHTGEFTNVTNRLTSADKAGVTESGVLALLINFGIVGLVAFYGLMILAAVSAPRRSWYQAALIAGIIQSFFYQSVEVLPFMIMFALIPLIARAFDVTQTSADAPPLRSSNRVARAGARR
jgi:hypothetical protein